MSVEVNLNDNLIIAGHEFKSRLLLGTGKFPSNQILKDSITSSESEIVTVALRRVDMDNPNQDDMLAAIDRTKVTLLPNTSGARNAEEAIRLAKLAKAAGCGNWVKLEITPEPRYLLPDPIETLKAAEQLVKDGFVVLPYINADPLLAKRLEEVGTATVMPLGSPIGSNRGIKTAELIKIIIEQAKVPVVVDAGIGSPAHAAEAMELGASAVLVNTAIAIAKDPIKTAYAFKLAVEAGRLSKLYGADCQSEFASASSPLTGFLHE